MAIPRSDRELLRAQSKAGRKGAEIYEASRTELNNQRRRAVERATHEAALRGAPGAAIDRIAANVNAPYTRDMRGMMAESTRYQADMTARAGRMSDYNKAVLAARHLIGDQVQQAVAPINAENAFNLGQIERESTGKVDAIEAQTRLTEAQMEAAALAYERQKAEEEARRRAAAARSSAGANRLDEDELGAFLRQDAQQMLGAVIDTTSGRVEQGQERAAREFQVEQNRPALEAVFGALKLASATAQYNSLRKAPPAVTLDEQQARADRLEELQQTIAGSRAMMTAYQPPEQPTPIARPMQVDPTGKLALPGATYRNGQFIAPSAYQETGTPGYNRLLASQRAQQEAETNMQAWGRNLQSLSGFLQEEYPQGFATGRGLQRDLRQIDPQAPDILGLMGPVYSPVGVEQALGGRVSRLPSSGGIPEQTAPQALQIALQLSGANLAKRRPGSFSYPEFMAAREDAYNPGTTLFDVTEQAAGRPTPSEAWEADQDVRAERAQLEQEALEDYEASQPSESETVARKNQETEDEFMKRFGVPYTPAMGPQRSVAEVTFDARFEPTYQAIKAAVDAADYDVDIEEIFRENGVTDPYMKRIIREMLS